MGGAILRPEGEGRNRPGLECGQVGLREHRGLGERQEGQAAKTGAITDLDLKDQLPSSNLLAHLLQHLWQAVFQNHLVQLQKQGAYASKAALSTKCVCSSLL